MSRPEAARRWGIPMAAATAGWAAIVLAAAATGVLAAEEGCPPGDPHCYGPVGTYYTVLGYELTAQVEPSILAGIGSVAVLGLLEAVRRRDGVEMGLPWRVAAALLAFPVLFLVAVAVAPTNIVY